MRTSYETRKATTNCHKEKTFTHKKELRKGKNKNYGKAQKKTKETYHTHTRQMLMTRKLEFNINQWTRLINSGDPLK